MYCCTLFQKIISTYYKTYINVYRKHNAQYWSINYIIILLQIEPQLNVQITCRKTINRSEHKIKLKLMNTEKNFNEIEKTGWQCTTYSYKLVSYGIN